MRKMHYGFIALALLLSSVTPAASQVNIGIEVPHVSIGINLPLLPELVPVPGYPVYYAPQVDSNYFFYDGMYWVFQDDNWYTSSWYNGPWRIVDPYAVPVFILRIPVHYYRRPPVYFHGWRPDAPPRWAHHWGREWEHRRRGWDRWNRSAVPRRAPLPRYQRQYSGDRYPHRIEQQHSIGRQHYRYQPRDTRVRQQFRHSGEQRGPAPVQRERREEPRTRSPRPQEMQRSMPPQHGGPTAPRPQTPYPGGERYQRQGSPAPLPAQQHGPAYQGQRQQHPGSMQHQQPAPGPQERGNPQPGRGHGEERRER